MFIQINTTQTLNTHHLQSLPVASARQGKSALPQLLQPSFLPGLGHCVLPLQSVLTSGCLSHEVLHSNSKNITKYLILNFKYFPDSFLCSVLPLELVILLAQPVPCQTPKQQKLSVPCLL